MSLRRTVEITNGQIMVVTDLHGNRPAFDRAIQVFRERLADETVDQLVICGDLIHAPEPGGPEDDSLGLLTDFIALQRELGAETVTLLCGNHEFPHIYGQPLSRGDTNVTAAFEQALTQSGRRQELVDYLSQLPFYVLTPSGVMLSHAGPSEALTTPEAAREIMDFDHIAFRDHVDDVLARYDMSHARSVYAANYGVSYAELAAALLGAETESDSHYDHLLRAFVLQSEAAYELLWGALFTRNEQSLPNDLRRVIEYEKIVQNFLKAVAANAPAYPPHIVVSGHIATRGGYVVVDDAHLRIASYAHAQPKESGTYLLFEAAATYTDADDLVPLLQPLFA